MDPSNWWDKGRKAAEEVPKTPLVNGFARGNSARGNPRTFARELNLYPCEATMRALTMEKKLVKEVILGKMDFSGKEGRTLVDATCRKFARKVSTRPLLLDRWLYR